MSGDRHRAAFPDSDDDEVVHRILLHLQAEPAVVRPGVIMRGPHPTSQWRRAAWTVMFFTLGLLIPGIVLTVMVLRFRGELAADGDSPWLMVAVPLLLLLVILLPIYAVLISQAPRLRRRLLRHPRIARQILADLEAQDAVITVTWQVSAHEIRTQLRRALKEPAADITRSDLPSDPR